MTNLKIAVSSLFVNALLAGWMLAGGWLTMSTWRRGEGSPRGRSVVFLALFAPFAVALLTRGAGLGTFLPSHETAIVWLGGAVMLAGITLWLHALSLLGDAFTLDMDARHDRVVDKGAYRVIRHPAYAGMIVVLFGYGMSTGDWVVALEFLVIPLAAFLHRISGEERALVSLFGEEYVAYARRTKRLIPFVY